MGTEGLPSVPGTLEAGVSEGLENTIKDAWSSRHAFSLSDVSLLIQVLLGRLHKELTAPFPELGEEGEYLVDKVRKDLIVPGN